jgi:sterol desaturase/sphingolipid hydroxylase (fatty acid hydroxylase superfamily)
MDIFIWIQGIAAKFNMVLKGLFFSEDSRLWWAWVLIAFPIIGAIIGAIELKREKKPVSLKSIFQFVFPKEIYKTQSFRNDLIIVFMLYLLYAVVIYFISILDAKVMIGKMIAFFNSGIMEQWNLAEYKKSWTKDLGTHLGFTFLAILLYDFGFTMLHFAFHKVPFLWKFHKVHHSAEVLTPFTVVRFHLVEFIFQKIGEGVCLGIVFGVFFYMLPAGIDLYKVFGLSLFGVLFSAIGVFRHTHIWISYGKFDYLLCSPAMHQIHHSKEPRHIDKNFSQIFSFWDYMLGSLYVPKEREKFEVGLSGDEDWNKGSVGSHFLAHFRNK